jgi:NAD(P)H-hydrate epimerase
VTPHPGEAAALLGCAPAEINGDRPAAARELASRTGAVVVLKGAATVIAQGDRLAVNPTGGPLLGSGGTGDVLAGMVGGFLAQGLAAFDAGAVAAWVHGRAGDALALRRGGVGVLAGEVAEELPETLQALQQVETAERSLGVGDAVAFPEPG